MTDSNLAEQARGLRADVGELAKSVAEVAGRLGQSEHTVKRLHRMTFALIVGLVLIVVMAVYSVALNRRVAALARCQAAYSAAYDAATAQRTRALTDATAAERAAERARTDAFDALFTDPAVNRPPGQQTDKDRETIQRLYAVYLKAAAALKTHRAAADKARAANPVVEPAAPNC